MAKLRESIKHNKYDAQALAEGTPFTPFVMETFGGLGKEAVGFIKKISYAYSELCRGLCLSYYAIPLYSLL